MKFIYLIPLLLLQFWGCAQGSSQKSDPGKTGKQRVGGSCEGCEAIYESKIPFESLSPILNLRGYDGKGPKLEISGIVYKQDGNTPAPNVVIYVYHTDLDGNYSNPTGEKGWGKRHGSIRGWLKTDKNGYYLIRTLRPASYPNSNNPQHIHITIKEPDKNEYWIDEFHFEDDPLLTPEQKQHFQNRGGSGLIKLDENKGVWRGARHIFLGKNVPDYPVVPLDKNLQSGLPLGASLPAFDPLHLSGADSGRKTCPMCKYGQGKGLMVWFNHANLDHMKEFAQYLENEMKERGEKNLRVFLIYMNPFYQTNHSEGEKILGRKIRQWCAEAGLKKVAMVWIPSPVDPETSGLYRINPEAKNTVFLYKKRKLAARWVNIDYSIESARELLRDL